MRILTILLSIFLFSTLNAQTKSSNKAKVSQISALNNYVDFMNESVHGLIVILKLLEIENQEINKYVDLDSYPLNNISNSDMMPNIFTDQSLYDKGVKEDEMNPLELAGKAKQQSTALPPDVAKAFNKKTDDIIKVLNETNQIRFEIEDYIGSHNLKVEEEIPGAYEILEKAKKLYFTYYTLQSDFYNNIGRHKSDSPNKTHTDLVKAFTDLHDDSRLILDALRFKNDNSFETLVANLKNSFDGFKLIEKKYATDPTLKSKNINDNLKTIHQKVKNILSSAEKFYQTAEVSDEYKQYGKYYYYHNNVIIPDVNRFGKGFVYEMNQVFNKLDIEAVSFIEIPLFFKVVYPEKIDDDNNIASTDPMIDKIPKKLKNRNIKESRYVIDADSTVIELELFDHMIQDGDIVSINFNGDWILEKHSIENKAKKLSLKLNTNGKNYLLLHAESVGRRPPNTMGIKYVYNNEKKEIELKSDLDVSELIEIKLN